MKKDRKLKLNRETLRNLEEEQLRNAGGGAPANSSDTESWRSCVSDVRVCYTDAC